MIYTLKQGSKTLGISEECKHYIIGFNNLLHARKVHYNIHPEPIIQLKRKNTLVINDEIHKKMTYLPRLSYDVTIGTNAHLVFPKMTGDFYHPLNNNLFYLDQYKDEEIITFPFTKCIGLILPFDLEEETDDELTFTSFIMDPFFDPTMFRF